MKRQCLAIMKWIQETLLLIKQKIQTAFKMNLEICISDGEEIVAKDKNSEITFDDLAEALADLTIELRILETKVQRLSELRDTLGYVPIYETGGKQ